MESARRRLAIFGASGLGRLVLDTLQQADDARVVAFLDSDAAKHGRRVDGVTVLGGLAMARVLRQRGVERVIVAIGENAERVEVAARLKSAGLSLASAIHPLASVAPSAHLGEHVILGPRAIVCAHARVGPHCVISAGAIVEHDDRLGAGVFLHPAVRLAGAVTVDDGATIGIGACVIQGRRVGRGARVAPGSVVISDVPAGQVVSGVPAHPASLNARMAAVGDRAQVAAEVASCPRPSGISWRTASRPVPSNEAS